MNETKELNPREELKSKWIQLKNENEKLRIRDGAEMLNVSELELLLTDIGSENPIITILNISPADILSRVKDLGYVMALTRNEHCVHERKGIYGEFQKNNQMGLFTGQDIDLRIFLSHWKYVVAVQDEKQTGDISRSIQFFDKFGTAVHKIHLNQQSDHEEFSKIVADYGNNDADTIIKLETKIQKAPIQKSELDDDQKKLFLDEWSGLQDTHDFFGLLNRYSVSRIQAMSIAEGKFCNKLDKDSVNKMLEKASANEIPIMVFVYNPGIVQIHTGTVQNIKRMGPWLNVFDKEFNLHLREDRISNVWLVRKPTADGDVQSIEVYDDQDELIVQFFGERKPGKAERSDWKNLCKDFID
ncbi:hemin-degrading factor [Leptospira sp. GIMC2001]|uniref:hemin-degrading factor n=1 Tax=Leptospira sp. GIMC2001 TaxID=1513297 RepID=UPI00234BC03C|nr:ChuX/HutX family heme-like substrate-binding protein [Leptospira sp. GIMC2001]WCL49113.1 hemin-degrading factor [Leptospira sp. GIMC2001]